MKMQAFEMCLCMFHTDTHTVTAISCHNRYFVRGDLSNLSYLCHKRRDLQSHLLSCYVQIVDSSAAAFSSHWTKSVYILQTSR